MQTTLGGISSGSYTVYVDWPSATISDPQNPPVDFGIVGPPVGFLSQNTLRLVSACGNIMFNMAIHEEFPAPPVACGGSSGWDAPVPQFPVQGSPVQGWASWITDAGGEFPDAVGYTCTVCNPPSNIPGQFRNPPQQLSTQANASAAQFIFAGSTDTTNLGKWVTAAPNRQIRYTDNGRDKVGTWKCGDP